MMTKFQISEKKTYNLRKWIIAVYNWPVQHGLSSEYVNACIAEWVS